MLLTKFLWSECWSTATGAIPKFHYLSCNGEKMLHSQISLIEAGYQATNAT
jgi:hypothetical protein